jgi:hypothetical protein
MEKAGQNNRILTLESKRKIKRKNNTFLGLLSRELAMLLAEDCCDASRLDFD